MSGGQAAERRIRRAGRKLMGDCRGSRHYPWGPRNMVVCGSGQVGTATQIPAWDGASCKLSHRVSGSSICSYPSLFLSKKVSCLALGQHRSFFYLNKCSVIIFSYKDTLKVKNSLYKASWVVHICSPSTREAKAGKLQA